MQSLRLTAIFLFLVKLSLNAQFNYGHQMDFGKNRIQLQKFVWTYYDYDRFRVYFYQGGNEIAKYVSVSANRQIPILEKRLDHQVDDKINILVYNNQQDFKQSNLGLSSEEMTNTGGVTRIIGDKISIFYNGSQAELDKQLCAALAELMVNQVLYSGNTAQMIKSSTLLNLPAWYTQGLIKWLSEGWSSYNDNLLYDAIKNDHFSNFNKLTGKQAANAGHALWYFIVDTYGESQIPAILYMTKASRSPDAGFIWVLGTSQSNLVYDMVDAQNRHLFSFKDSSRTSPIKNNSILTKYKTFRHYYQPRVSPDGKKVMYAVNELNQLRVYVKDERNYHHKTRTDLSHILG